MHDPHPTNGPPAPQTAPVEGFDADRATLPDGRAALVLTYQPTGHQGLSWDAQVLRATLAATRAAVVVFRPHGIDQVALLDAVSRCDPAQPVLATAAPVTDAIKRVRGPMVLGTVDRTQLAWAVGPAAVDTTTLRQHLQQDTGATVQPLAAAGGGLAWL